MSPRSVPLSLAVAASLSLLIPGGRLGAQQPEIPVPAPQEGATLEPQGELAGLSFFLGTWDLRTSDLRPGGERVEGRATSHAYLTLDGYVLLDDFRSLGPDGEVVFRGTSVRTADPRSDGFLIHWIMTDVPGHTIIRAHWEDDALLGEGRGFDGMGEFLERFRYDVLGPDRYRFTLDRSYDGGETWIEDFGIIEATRRPGG